MTPLHPDAQEIVELGRDLDDPSDDDRNRHRARLVAHLGAAAAITVAVPAAASGTAAGAGTLGAVAGTALWKSALVFALLGGTAGGAVCALSGIAREHADARPVETQIAPPAPSHEGSAAGATAARLSEIAPPEVTAFAPMPPSASAPARRETRESPVAVQQPVPAAPVQSGSALQEEVDLIRRAHEALRNGDPALALRYVGEHAARFPNGALAQERVAARVLAVCSLHQPGAADEARAFLAARPDSPLAARVRAVCGL